MVLGVALDDNLSTFQPVTCNLALKAVGHAARTATRARSTFNLNFDLGQKQFTLRFSAFAQT